MAVRNKIILDKRELEHAGPERGRVICRGWCRSHRRFFRLGPNTFYGKADKHKKNQYANSHHSPFSHNQAR